MGFARRGSNPLAVGATGSHHVWCVAKFRQRESNPGRSVEGRVSYQLDCARVVCLSSLGFFVCGCILCVVLLSCANSDTEIRTRVARVWAEYLRQFNYSGVLCVMPKSVSSRLFFSNFLICLYGPSRTRTGNPQLRGLMPYPLGHGAAIVTAQVACIV